jgi:replicative DNA helicase
VDLAALERLVVERGNGHNVLVVDYLQKVPMVPEPTDEADRVTRVTEGLKEIALTRDVAVLATVAADMAGLESRRLRLQHLRGSSALAYESDVVIILNEKVRALSKVHLSFSTSVAEASRQQVIFSVEKNRGGPAMLDMEFRKDFAHFRFDPDGRYVAERLVDDIITVE